MCLPVHKKCVCLCSNVLLCVRGCMRSNCGSTILSRLFFQLTDTVEVWNAQNGLVYTGSLPEVGSRWKSVVIDSKRAIIIGGMKRNQNGGSSDMRVSTNAYLLTLNVQTSSATPSTTPTTPSPSSSSTTVAPLSTVVTNKPTQPNSPTASPKIAQPITPFPTLGPCNLEPPPSDSFQCIDGEWKAFGDAVISGDMIDTSVPIFVNGSLRIDSAVMQVIVPAGSFSSKPLFTVTGLIARAHAHIYCTYINTLAHWTERRI